jgi:hypothetical protein
VIRACLVGWVLGIGFWGGGQSSAQTVILSGENQDYSGVPIHFSIPGNPFLELNIWEKTVICDERGGFRLDMKSGSATVVQLEFGTYESALLVEPGKEYRLILPAYREGPYPEIVSPFYQPVRVALKVSGSQQDVNNEVYRFDSLFSIFNDQLLLFRQMRLDPPADSLIERLSSEFSSGTNPWFDQYRNYKSGILKLNEGKTSLENISQEYLGSVVREQHPAFLELFGAMFHDFLVYYNRSEGGEGIRYHINRTHNLDSLRRIVAGHPAVLNDTLTDLILLQELPSLFYSGEFHKEAILILLDSMKSNPIKPSFAAYAEQILSKLSSLVIGHSPPDFSLKAIEGGTFSPADFAGRYTYLMFCTPDQYGCMIEYPFLESFHLKHPAYLEVVTIMVAERAEQVASFMERNHYSWKALWYEGDIGLLRDYQIKAFPVAYLIGPDGKLVLSPAPLPSDGFEQHLFRIMRSRGEI